MPADREFLVKVVGALIAALGLWFVILRHWLEFGVKVGLTVCSADGPPLEIGVINLSKGPILLKSLKIRRFRVNNTAKEFVLKDLINGGNNQKIDIHQHLNNYIWEKGLPVVAPPTSSEWVKETERLEIAIGFDSRMKAYQTKWVPVSIRVSVHGTRGSRVDGIESA